MHGMVERQPHSGSEDEQGPGPVRKTSRKGGRFQRAWSDPWDLRRGSKG
jgi:hypothetical protein